VSTRIGKRPHPALGIGLFLAGAAVGVLVQKYYGIGRVLAYFDSTAIATEPETREPALPVVDPASLHGKRVMVALVFGQSNVANSGETPAAAGEGVYVFHEGLLHPAVDPLPGAPGRSGSVWTRLGPQILAAELADAVVFVPVTVGGTRSARWAPGGDLHHRIHDALDALDDAGIRVTHLLWHQGESDAGKLDAEGYKSTFRAMLGTIRARGVNAPVLVSVATLCRDRRPDAAIRQAQQELADPRAGIYPGPDTDLLGYAYRYDGCHFSTEGLVEFAQAWYESLHALNDVVSHTYLWSATGAGEP
jgi:hypothetical protein